MDIIVVVRNAMEWHRENFRAHRHHYGPISLFGASAVQCNASRVGVGLHFNPYVQWKGRLVKYGVVSLSDALRDLWHWDALYLAGRLHKPTRLVVQSDCKCLDHAMQSNRRAAAAAALLMLPSACTQEDLFRTVVGLSYTGDVRMGLAEDSNKVGRIAAGSADALRQLYTPQLLQEAAPGLTATAGGHLERQPDAAATAAIAASLPHGCLVAAARQQRISTAALRTWRLPDRPLGGACTHCQGPPEPAPHEAAATAEALCRAVAPAVWLPAALARVVRRSSRRQALAGLLATSPSKSLSYVGAKLWKRIASVA
eukprot:jgi/Ulvmu1/12817/UM097_0046.1